MNRRQSSTTSSSLSSSNTTTLSMSTTPPSSPTYQRRLKNPRNHKPNGSMLRIDSSMKLLGAAVTVLLVVYVAGVVLLARRSIVKSSTSSLPPAWLTDPTYPDLNDLPPESPQVAQRDFERLPERPHYSKDDFPASQISLVGRRHRLCRTGHSPYTCYYTPVPSYAKRKFFAIGKFDESIRRVFVQLGWQEVAPDDYEQAHIFFQFRENGNRDAEHLLPFQRYSRITQYSDLWDDKDVFQLSFRAYQQRTGFVPWFLPKTFRLTKSTRERQQFVDLLNRGGGMNLPWLLKKTDEDNGKGIEVLPPHSHALQTAVSRIANVTDDDAVYVVQQYLCNELTWFRGEKFDLRMYWLVASIDPLIVLFEDGYARVGASMYNESSWDTTGQHLTNHNFRGDDADVTYRHLWKRVRQHYEEHKSQFVARGITDPVYHVRSQMKEAIARLVAATKMGILERAQEERLEENQFSFYGCDFILDADLDIWFIEGQDSPAISDYAEYRVDMWQRLFPPMINMVEEIATKQAEDPTANLLPLKSQGGWEIVYAGDTLFRYHGYVRSKNKKSCIPNLVPSNTGHSTPA